VRLVHHARERQAAAVVRRAHRRLDDVVVTLEPLTKFPVIRDSQVDRTPMFDALKRVKAWIPIDGSYDLGPAPALAAEQEISYAFSRCMTCGCCMEVCPQYNDQSDFMGPAPLAQVRLFNAHPTADERARAPGRHHGRGGLVDCGNAQAASKPAPRTSRSPRRSGNWADRPRCAGSSSCSASEAPVASARPAWDRPRPEASMLESRTSGSGGVARGMLDALERWTLTDRSPDARSLRAALLLWLREAQAEQRAWDSSTSSRRVRWPSPTRAWCAATPPRTCAGTSSRAVTPNART
jgi:ferredoxin